MKQAGDKAGGKGLGGRLLPWLATMLLIGSVPYLALYTGWMPGTDLLLEAGIDVRSPVGAVLAALALLLSLGTLAWSFRNSFSRSGRG